MLHCDNFNKPPRIRRLQNRNNLLFGRDIWNKKGLLMLPIKYYKKYKILTLLELIEKVIAVRIYIKLSVTFRIGDIAEDVQHQFFGNCFQFSLTSEIIATKMVISLTTFDFIKNAIFKEMSPVQMVY